MRSPFPGMDPYVESRVHWPDFHDRFINSLSETIADTLPQGYFARIQEDVLLLEPEPGESECRIEPDVLVGRKVNATGAGLTRAASATATLEPATFANVIHLDPHIEHFIEIVRMPDARVVTVVEVLSPTNKSGGGRGVYMEKRSRLIHAGDVSVVEIDLLRAGRRISLSRPLPDRHYHVLLSRADDRPKCEVYSWNVRDRLPAVPIPLASPLPDASANLATAFEMAYARGRYGNLIQYEERPPAPDFSPPDDAWVRQTAASQKSNPHE